MQETQQARVRSLGQEYPLEKEAATHSSILAWEIPWTKEPGGLQSMGLQSQTRLSKLPYASLFSMAVLRSIKATSSASSSKHEHLINYFFKKKRNCFSWLALRRQVQQLTDSTFSQTCHGQGLIEVVFRFKMQKLPSHFLLIILSSRSLILATRL